jgi:hypothetical protein
MGLMQPGSLVASAAALLFTFGVSGAAAAAADSSSINLVLKSGRPLRVALDQKISVKHVGQPVTGTVVGSVYAYDRIVIPSGTKVRGHLARIDGASRLTRVRAYLGGDFSPPSRVVLQFDTLLLADGREMPIDTVVTGGIPNVRQQVAGGAGSKHPPAEPVAGDESLASRAGGEIRQRASDAISSAKQQASDALDAIKRPGKMDRLKEAVIARLPYHPQYLAQGLVYDVALTSPLGFGAVTPSPLARAGTAPAPDSILTARLATALDSSKTPKGTPLEAVLTEPVFSSDHQLILPEGSTLAGEVTQAKQARRFHKNGQLRFLFEKVQAPEQQPSTLLAALHSVQASDDDHVAVDEEGGTTVTNPKTRFIAPTLAVLALRSSIDQDGRRYADPDGDGSIHTAGSGVGSRGMGGFLGFGLLGAAVGQITRPIGIGLAVVGAGRTVYTNILGKGREVSFPADTPIQVRLAPGPTPGR